MRTLWSKRVDPCYFVNKSVKNKPILHVFGTRNNEKISDQKINKLLTICFILEQINI